MTLDELVAWLDTHVDDLMTFMDYEVTRRPEDVLLDNMKTYWLAAGDDFNAAGHRFIHLGHDGTGGDVVAWLRCGTGAPVIGFFGSEGGVGVFTTTPLRWAQVLAYGPGFDEYPGAEMDGPAVLERENWMLDADEVDAEDFADATAAQARYRAAVEDRFGPLPPFEDLVSGVEALGAELQAWARSESGHEA